MKLSEWLPTSQRFQSVLRRLEDATSFASLYWRGRLWLILIWACGIPLSTIGFVTMLFWAYGAND